MAPVPIIRASALHAVASAKDRLARGAGATVLDEGSYSPRSSAGTVPLAHYADALAQGARRSNEREFAFLTGLHMDPRVLGPAGYSLRLARTLGDGLDLFCRDFASVQSGSAAWLERREGRARIVYRVDASAGSAAAQDVEASLGLVVGALRRLTSREPPNMRLRFAHQAIGPSALKQKATGKSVLHGRGSDSIEFDAALLDRQLPDHDPQLLALTTAAARRVLDAGSHDPYVLPQFHTVLAMAVENGTIPDLQSVAMELDCAPRTLQSRLAAAGTTWRAELRAALMARGRALLAQPGATVTRVALDLGYSEASAFSRVYSAHFGRPPSRN